MAVSLQLGRATLAITPGRSEEAHMRNIRQFVNDDQGADLIEYALLAGLISLAAVTALGTVGTSITGLFGKISTKLNGITVP
jgi:pilus assembly protein Flp/PilA